MCVNSISLLGQDSQKRKQSCTFFVKMLISEGCILINLFSFISSIAIGICGWN